MLPHSGHDNDGSHGSPLPCARWHPQPIPQPRIDRCIGEHSAIERVAEILRYRLSCLEFWLSPSGVLREWLRVWLRLALLLLVPALLVLPVLVAIAVGVADLSAQVAGTCANVLKAMLAIAGVALVCSALAAWLSIYRRGL